jgi:hypothetical protein
MIQESEAITLLLGVIAAPIALRLLRAHALPRAAFVGLAFLVGAYVFTIAEGFFLADLLNAAEHLSLAASGVAFAAAAAGLARGRDGADAA